jgi:MoxR-like ATPase
VRGAGSLKEAADKLGTEENAFFSMRFLLPRPLLRALMSDKPVVLLIDEIDRADAEFEAFLLEILSDFQASVPEIGTIKAKTQPMVVLTSNNTRELSEALKRRALYLFVDYPSFESELKIVRLRAPDLAPKVAEQIVQVVQRLRELDLKKSPSVAETVDWAKALVSINADALDEKTLNDTLSVILKHEADIQRAKRTLMKPSQSREVGLR